MRIWTIQPAGLYEEIKAKQVLFADGRRCHHMVDRNAYLWMIDQMRHRLSASKARFPWWGWYRYLGVRKAKPDLRAVAHLPTGQKGVRIELEIHDSEVLLSKFGDWHYVLNNWFLPYDEAEDEAFDRELKRLGLRHRDPLPKALQSKVPVSWERIFDLGTRGQDGRGRYCERGIQATFWGLRLRDVTDVTFFTAR